MLSRSLASIGQTVDIGVIVGGRLEPEVVEPGESAIMPELKVCMRGSGVVVVCGEICEEELLSAFSWVSALACAKISQKGRSTVEVGSKKDLLTDSVYSNDQSTSRNSGAERTFSFQKF